jgi:hypothetical protein
MVLSMPWVRSETFPRAQSSYTHVDADHTNRPPSSSAVVLGRALFAIAVAMVLWHLRAFLALHTLPARGDPALPFQGSDLTPQWAPWLRVSIETLWQQGTLAFWNPFINGGSPQFEVPEAGVLSLATLLGGVLPVEAAIKWSMLAHVVAGMAGVRALSRRLGVAPPFAALGAFSFGLGTYLLDHFRVGHLSHIEPMCLAPWALLFLWRALSEQRGWWRHAIAAGLVVGVEVLEGGSSVVVYTGVAHGLLLLTCGGRDIARWFGRLVAVGAIAGVIAFATAAPQLLPMLAYLELTGRRGGLSLADSSRVIQEVARPLPSVLAFALMALGVGRLVAIGQRRAAVWLASIVAAGIAVAMVPAVYEWFWRYVPGIRYQRIPERAVVLVGIAGPVLVAAGAEGLWDWAGLKAGPYVRAAFAVVLAAFVAESWVRAPKTPPMADPRIERQDNHAMRWLVEHAAGSRVHVWESPNRHWGSDNITVPLGLEAITSYTPTEHRDYLPGDFDDPERRTYLGVSYSNPARFWGMLDVRYAISSTPRSDPGWTLAARVDPCPIEVCQPAKSAGTFIYENSQWMPRAWVVQHAIALVGRPDEAFAASLDLMARDDFDPAAVVVLQIEPGAPVPRVDAIFSVGDGTSNAVPWKSEPAQSLLSRVLQSRGERPAAARFTRIDNNHLMIDAAADGWLVVSEKFAIYPGWSAAISGREFPLLRANGVLSAMPIQGDERVTLSYLPRRFWLGTALLAVMALAIGMSEWRYRRTS